MRRIMTMTTAALFIAAMTSPSLADETQHKHPQKKPIVTQPAENTEGGTAKEPQPPVESLTIKEEIPAPGIPLTDTKPAPAPVPNPPGRTDKATTLTEDRATGMGKEKTSDAVGDTAKSSSLAPRMPESNSASGLPQ